MPRTLSTYGQTRKPTRVEHAAQIQHQDATHQAALANSGVATTQGYQLPQTVDPGNQFPITTANQGTTAVNPRTGQTYSGAAAARLNNRLTDTSRLTLLETAGVTESQQDFEARKASIEAQNTEILNQEKAKREMELAMKGETETPTLPEEQTQPLPGSATGTMIEKLKAMAASDPDMAKFIPQIEGLLASQNSGQAEKDYMDQMSEVNASDRDNDGVSDGVEEAVAESKTMLAGDKAKSNSINEKNRDIALEAASIAKELAETQKKQFELKQLAAENAQRQANVENEIRNRRILAKFGGASDTNGLKWMGEQLQKGQDALNNLVESGNLTEAIYNLQIGREYNNNVQTALNNWEATQFQLDTNYRKEVSDLDRQVSLDAKERREERQKITDRYVERKDAADQRTFDFLKGVTSSLMVAKIQERAATKRAEAQEAAADERMRFQEEMQNQRLGVQLSNQERIQANTERKMEKAEEKLVRSDFMKVNDSQTVKDYAAIRNATNKAQAAMKDAIKNGGRLDKAIMAEVTTVLYEKGLDPNSVVREGEYLRAALGQSIYDKGRKAIEAAFGGDMTGITSDMVSAMQRVMESMTRSQRESAQAEYAGAINRLVDFNSGSLYYNINPATITLPDGISIPDWAVKAYYEDEEEANADSSFDIDWDEEYGTGEGGGGSGFGDSLSMLGRFTQTFDTPIADRAHGGLYEPSTVSAWGGRHAGLDIAVPQGSGFRSLVAGEIIEIGEEPGWGGTVVIRDAKGAEHRISHLSEINPKLKKGAKVSKGTALARTGGAKGAKGSGNSTGPHIDYRIRYSGKYIDPLKYHA